MSDVFYVKCDGCGLIEPEPREESWHRMHVARWAEVLRRDYEDDGIVTYDYCPECFDKMLKAVE